MPIIRAGVPPTSRRGRAYLDDVPYPRWYTERGTANPPFFVIGDVCSLANGELRRLIGNPEADPTTPSVDWEIYIPEPPSAALELPVGNYVTPETPPSINVGADALTGGAVVGQTIRKPTPRGIVWEGVFTGSDIDGWRAVGGERVEYDVLPPAAEFAEGSKVHLVDAGGHYDQLAGSWIRVDPPVDVDKTYVDAADDALSGRIDGIAFSQAKADAGGYVAGDHVIDNGRTYELNANRGLRLADVADVAARDALLAVDGCYVLVTGGNYHTYLLPGGWTDTGSTTEPVITVDQTTLPSSGKGGIWSHWIDVEMARTYLGRHAVERYNVRGSGANAVENAVYMQAAFDAMPVGGVLCFDIDTYATTQGIVKTGAFNIEGADADDSYIRVDLDGADTTTDALSIAVDSARNKSRGDYRNGYIRDIKIQTNGGGRHAIYVDVDSPHSPINRMLVQNCNLRGTVANGGRSFFAHGQLFTAATIHNCQLSTGITLDGCADGSTIDHCQIFGDDVGIVLDIVNGAYKTTIRDNFITCRDNSIRVIDGSQIDIIENQMEQHTVNASADSAHVILDGIARTCEGIRILGNNFGGGSNIDRSIRVRNARETLIDSANNFNHCAIEDIEITSAAEYTRIGDNNIARGASRVHKEFPLTITDEGVGTFGVIKDFVGFENSWTGGQYVKRSDGVLEIIKAFSGGATAANTIMATLPIGDRAADLYAGFATVPCATSGGMGTLKFNSTTGRVQVGTLPSNASVGVGTRVQTKTVAA